MCPFCQWQNGHLVFQTKNEIIAMGTDVGISSKDAGSSLILQGLPAIRSGGLPVSFRKQLMKKMQIFISYAFCDAIDRQGSVEKVISRMHHAALFHIVAETFSDLL